MGSWLNVSKSMPKSKCLEKIFICSPLSLSGLVSLAVFMKSADFAVTSNSESEQEETSIFLFNLV